MIEPQRWTTLPDEVVPPVPETRRTAPIAEIRRQARRRRATSVGAALAVVVVMAAAVAVGASIRPPVAAAPPLISRLPPPPAGAVPWAMAKVHADQRRLTIGVLYAEPPPNCREHRPVARVVVEDPEVIVITVTETALATSCADADPARVVVPATLRSPIGTRRLVDGFDGAERHYFHARQVPVPTYPPGLLTGGDDKPATADGDLLGWAIGYGGVEGGPDIGLFISARRPDGSDGERVSINGREAWLVELPERGRGHGYRVVWQVEGSWIQLSVVWGPERPATRADLQTVIDGLSWS